MGQSVHGFFPIKRFDDELPEGFVSGNAVEEPVERVEEAKERELVVAAAEDGKDAGVNGHEVAEEEVEEGKDEKPLGKDGLEDGGAGEEPKEEDEPEEEVHEEDEGGAADEEDESEESAEADGADEVEWAAGVHEKGLHVAFDPAGALADPVANAAVGFFVGGGVDGGDTEVAGTGADAKVGVFGDVEGVPAAEVA